MTRNIKTIHNHTLTISKDGEGKVLSKEEVINSKEIVVEPSYIKLYIEDLLILNGLTKGSSNILHSLLQKLNYDNEIVLTSGIKREIAEKLNVKINTIDQALLKFCKKEILIRKDRGRYLANPYILARGKWNKIKELRMTVDYNHKGREIKTTALYK